MDFFDFVQQPAYLGTEVSKVKCFGVCHLYLVVDCLAELEKPQREAPSCAEHATVSECVSQVDHRLVNPEALRNARIVLSERLAKRVEVGQGVL